MPDLKNRIQLKGNETDFLFSIVGLDIGMDKRATSKIFATSTRAISNIVSASEIKNDPPPLLPALVLVLLTEAEAEATEMLLPIVLSIFDEQDKQVIKQIRSLLQEYLESFKIYKNHKIIELENILTVGIPKDIVEISNLVFCEICGYGMSSEEELLVHRRSHGMI